MTIGIYNEFFCLLSYYLRIVHLSILTIQRRLALSLHKDDTLFKEIYQFFLHFCRAKLETSMKYVLDNLGPARS